MSPDEFYSEAQTWAMLALRDNEKTGAALTFGEGYKLAQDLALKMTDVYRRAALNIQQRASADGTKP